MKYKETAAPGWIVKIDDLGNAGQSFTKQNKPGWWAEKETWEAEGNEIEPFETAEEIAAREAKEAIRAIKTQRAECQRLLDETDKTMVSDWPYPEDKAKNESFRAELRAIMKSDKIQEIPDKPFSNP